MTSHLRNAVILTLQIAPVCNTVREAFSANPAEMMFVGLAAVSLATYEAAQFYRNLARCADCRVTVQAQPLAAFGIASAAALIAGHSAGRWCAGRNGMAAQAPWLAALPWPAEIRAAAFRHATRIQALTLCCLAACLAVAAALALRLDYAVACAASVTGLFGAGFATGARTTPVQTRAENMQRSATATNRFPAPLARLDRAAPAHTGRWAWHGAKRAIAAACVTLFIPLGASAAAVSLTQHRAVLALGVAVLGANLAFIAAVRCRPLTSAIFRASPLGFAAAASAVLRAPLAVSVAWFIAAAAIPFVATPGAWRILPGMAAGLLLLNALYAAAALSRPASPRQALLLYGAAAYAILYETATGGVPLGAVTLAIICAMALLLCRRARKTYRANHG